LIELEQPSDPQGSCRDGKWDRGAGREVRIEADEVPYKCGRRPSTAMRGVNEGYKEVVRKAEG
jgi:hypothetical protein